MNEIVFVAVLFGWHFLMGAVLGYGALSFYEISVEHGAAFSLIFTVSVVLTEQWFGSTFVETPWPMLKNGIIASIIGGVLGLAAILLVFEPDTKDTGADPGTVSNNSEKAD